MPGASASVSAGRPSIDTVTPPVGRGAATPLGGTTVTVSCTGTPPSCASAGAAAGVGVAACGSSNDSGSKSGATGGKTGGSITIGSVLPDAYDPVLSQTVQANQPLQLVYTGLVTYKHTSGAAGNDLIPGLAEAMPTISADRKTYTFK